MKMNKKGITLVEVIVVLIIMAVLAGILVASYTGYIDKAKDDKALVEARAAFLAASTIYSEAYAEGAFAEVDPDEDGNITWTLETTDAYYKSITDLAGVEGEIDPTFTINNGKIIGMSYKSSAGDTWTLTNGVWGK